MANILFAVSEVDGLVKTGGLADVARHLPEHLLTMDFSCLLALPHYQVLNHLPDLPTMSQVCQFELENIGSDQTFAVTVRQFNHRGLDIVTFAINDLYDRDGLYDHDYQAFADNGLRFGLFSYAIVQFFRDYSELVGFNPNIYHCNDWHTGLVPLFAKYHLSANVHSVLTIHNGAFQGEFDISELGGLSALLPEEERVNNRVNYLTLAIKYSDKVIAVSPNYATELLSELGSHQLQSTFMAYKDKLTGILNGCDYDIWNPSNDKYLTQQYDIEHLDKKSLNKSALQKWAGLPINKDIPVFAQVSRLTEQKGLEYMLPSILDVLEHPVQFVIIGTGNPKFTEQLQELMLQYPEQLFFFNGYSDEINHQVMAGADFFLIPSLFEPCGLTQMHALAYGTLPIARKVGGLVDTVIDINDHNGNGILFAQPEVASLSSALRRATILYLTHPQKLRNAQHNAMTCNFSWQRAANTYQSLYKQLLSI